MKTIVVIHFFVFTKYYRKKRITGHLYTVIIFTCFLGFRFFRFNLIYLVGGRL
jgi:hypothetical protein